YLLRSIQNSGIQLTEQLSSYKLHQRQLKMKLLSSYITNLCCAPTRTCFKFPCQFTTPRLYQARLVAIENTTRTGLSKDTFDSVLTIQKKTLYSLKTNLTQPYISIF
ncbi:mCG1042239, partial [Mus musculus]